MRNHINIFSHWLQLFLVYNPAQDTVYLSECCCVHHRMCNLITMRSHRNEIAIAVSAAKSLLAMPAAGYANALIDVLCSIQKLQFMRDAAATPVVDIALRLKIHEGKYLLTLYRGLAVCYNALVSLQSQLRSPLVAQHNSLPSCFRAIIRANRCCFILALELNRRLETASTQAKPTCVGFKPSIFP